MRECGEYNRTNIEPRIRKYRENFMSEQKLSIDRFYKGWDVYQQQLVKLLAPLSLDQLALRASPHHWSIGMIATHIVAIRAGWFHMMLGEGSAELAPLAKWDRSDQPSRTAAEIVTGLEATWQMIQDALSRWTPADLKQKFQDRWPGVEYRGDEPWYSRQWVIWHVLEHDLLYGGELSLALGMNGLAAFNL